MAQVSRSAGAAPIGVRAGGTAKTIGTPKSGALAIATNGARLMPVVYFKMSGEDNVTNGLWDSWVVTGSPDPTGAQYLGALSRPLRNIFIDGPPWSM